MIPSRERFIEIIQQCFKNNFPKIKESVCEDHGVCFCEGCSSHYNEIGFTGFNNICTHFEGQCLKASTSETYINELELLHKYIEYLCKVNQKE